MNIYNIFVFIFILISFPNFTLASEKSVRLSDQKIKRILIKNSIDNYYGSCPCPYNYARNGSQCGGRSAWSRPGGYSPVCFPKDVTKGMIEDWRRSNAQQ